MSVVEQALCPVIVGREEELAVLEDALYSATRGEGRLVALAGDAGLGKTRLATELTTRARSLGSNVLWGGCAEGDLALPYLPFLEAVGNWLAGHDVVDINRRLGPVAGEVAQLFPQLGEAPAAQSGDASQAKLRLYEGVLALLALAAGERGGLVVIEDIHWADASTRELLDYMTRRVRSMPIMVLATYRADELHRRHPLLPIVQGWRRSRQGQLVDLGRLPAEDVARMVGAIFQEATVSEEFRDFMHERSEGNPFVLEELLKEAVDRGDIYRTATGWDRKSLSDLRLPRSVSEGILLRVERLDPDHAEILRAASVLGQSFTYEALAELAGLDESSLRSALQTSVQQQLLEEDRNAPGRYRFRHALTREAVYLDLIAPRRQELHGRAADVLSVDPRTPRAEIAHHLLAAGRVDEAAPLCIEAGDEAVRKHGYREAVELYERALPHATGERERVELLGRLGRALAGGMDLSSAARYLTQSIEGLEALGRPIDAASERLILGRVRWTQNSPKQAQEEYERARDALSGESASGELATAYIRLAGLAVFDLRNEEGLAHAKRAVAVAEEAGSDEMRVWAYGFVGLAMVGLRLEEEGLAWLRRSVDQAIAHSFFDVADNALHNLIIAHVDFCRAREAEPLVARYGGLPESPWHRFSSTFVAGLVDFCLGRVERSLERHEAGRRLAGEGTSAIWHRWSDLHAHQALVELCRFDEARALLEDHSPENELQDVFLIAEQRIRHFLAIGDFPRAASEARIMVRPEALRGRFQRVMGDVVDALVEDGAVEEARGALEMANVPEEGGVYPIALRASARILLAEGDAAGAGTVGREAVARLGAIGYRLEESRARLTLAESLAKTDDRSAAAEELARVLADVRACGSVILERRALALAERLGLDVDIDEEESSSPTVGGSPAPGERLVTVMFADVRGYTAMTNREAPAEMAQRMTSFYAWTRRQIERHGGMVDRFGGDSVMASFNVARETMDHCLNALQAAIALQDRSRAEDLPLGIGIAVGTAIVGRLTGTENVEVIGRTTNLAARLQAQAQRGEIVLDGEAYRRVRSWADERRLIVEERALELKGFDAAVPAYVVRGSESSS